MEDVYKFFSEVKVSDKFETLDQTELSHYFSQSPSVLIFFMQEKTRQPSSICFIKKMLFKNMHQILSLVQFKK